MMKEFLLFLVSIASVFCQPCSKVESLNITNGELFQNGSVVSDGVEYLSTAWYEVEEGGIVSRFGCPCIGRACLWKCCPEGQMRFNRTECQESDHSLVNPFSPPLFKGSTPVETVAHEHFFYMYNKLCDETYYVSNSAYEEIYIQENGTLYEIANGRVPLWHKPSIYCVDMIERNNSTKLFAAVCFSDGSPTDDSAVLYTAYAVGLLLSVPFLLATFLVYALIPELRNLHGLCLMSYCAGLVVAYVFLAYLKLQTGSFSGGKVACLSIAVIIYYSFQTSFFWLNVMCFDIWRTFSGYRGSGTNKRRERRRFMMYGLYAWGVPLVLTACTLGMQFADLPDGIVKPGFGAKRCWFEDWLSSLVYFFVPILVLVACNVVLFSVTAYRIRSIRQETAILKGSESARSDKLKKDKQRYGLYLKLFVVMGVNWSVELLSFAVGGSNWYWILTDFSNIGLGCFIFFIFVWKKKVRNLTAKRFRTLFGMAAPAPDMRKSPWTSSSHTEDTRISASADDPSIKLRDLR